MSASVEEAISRVPSFRRLRPEDRQRLASVSSVRSYGRGETVFREGDPSSWFIVLAAGRVKVAKTTLAGRDVILEVFGKGSRRTPKFRRSPSSSSAEKVQPWEKPSCGVSETCMTQASTVTAASVSFCGRTTQIRLPSSSGSGI